MRDIAITFIIFGLVPFIFTRPYIGVLVWSWIGYMNPHRLAYGFAHNFPFALIVIIATFIGLLVTKEKYKLPLTGLAKLWFVFILWMCITTVFSIDISFSFPELIRTIKIQLVVLLTMLVIFNKERINQLIWVIVLSLGFYGIKGGLFSIATGGKYRVWGPENSFIADNNTLALALIMTLPLMFYLYKITAHKYLRYGLLASMILTGLSILTSFSRGALLAASVMLLMFLMKSKNKIRYLFLLVLLLPALLYFMPSSWYERMSTIETYQEDSSAMGRLQAWQFAFDMARSRFAGGGFNSFSEANYRKYSPDVANVIASEDNRFQDAHSIYFEVLAEHGFIGLLIFLLIGISAIVSSRKIINDVKTHQELQWVGELAAMIQVSLIGYAVGGTFLGLAYFDLPYHLVAILVILRGTIISQYQAEHNRNIQGK